MMVADIVRAAGSAVLAWGIIHGALEMSVLLVVATVAATCRVFHRPALQASIVQLVPESGLNRANSLFQMADAAANLIAPAAKLRRSGRSMCSKSMTLIKTRKQKKTAEATNSPTLALAKYIAVIPAAVTSAISGYRSEIRPPQWRHLPRLST